MKRQLVYTFKANKKNLKILEKRGLFSNDPMELFDLFQSLKENKDFTLRLNTTSDLILSYFFNIGLK